MTYFGEGGQEGGFGGNESGRRGECKDREEREVANRRGAKMRRGRQRQRTGHPEVLTAPAAVRDKVTALPPPPGEWLGLEDRKANAVS